DLSEPHTTLDPGQIISLSRDIAELLPGETTRLASLGKRLATLAIGWSGSTAGVVHGDFHIGQVVVGSQRILLVDLDRAGVGHPVVDLGSFLASLVEAGVDAAGREAFLDGYRQETSDTLDADLLRAATAAALFRRVTVPLRQLHPAWPDRIRERLDLIEQFVGTVTS
ncbi:MAG: aminoglycoside phosphotransferase family protein, partial [Acidobacteriota bacterium]|nr:aminoglycoside phosphotransferase family protein [Acidobacteriota bacterium]